MDLNDRTKSIQHTMAHAQGTRLLFRRTNFFVIAPSSKNARDHLPEPRLASGDVEADFGGGHASSFGSAIDMKVGLLDSLTNPDRDRAAFHLRVGAMAVPAWLEAILVMVFLAGSFAAHAINLFYYPHYELDEGTYLMYAWAVTHGSITNYPYGYGHPPLAWIMVALWVQLSGGFSTFGTAINSGRVLVLLLTIVSSLLVYRIARKMGAGISAGLLALAIFSFSPISITFQREVLLDNFATFWFLLSLYLIVASKSRLSYIVSAAIFFGFSLLSKEVMVVYIPVMIYVVWLHTTRFQRTFALVAFIFLVFAAGFSFVLMAALKGELFPYSWHLPWDHHPHLSLMDTFFAQTQRGQSQGSFLISWDAWVSGDPFFIFLGIAAPTFNLITGWWDRKRLFLSLFALSFWVLLARGGVDFTFYILPLIPIIALNSVFALKTLTGWIARCMHFELVAVFLMLIALVALMNYDFQRSTEPTNLFTQRPSLVQTEALTWIRTQVPRRAMIVINSNLYTDLHEQEGDGVGDGTTYPHAEVYWNVAFDPELHGTLLQDNWDRIDYIVADPGMLQDIKNNGGDMELIETALEHSILRVEFKGDEAELIQIYQVIHTGPSPSI
jgi:4-amino-4-deoxy-L-arabinose transferase-like glycosyltransferase